MNLIPDEVETLIFKDLNYMDLKHYAQTSRARTNLVYRHLAPIAGRARERFGLGPKLSDQDIIERLYHVNGYTSSSFDNVTVGSLGWRGPGGSISREALSWYNVSGKLHREDGPAHILYDGGNRYESWYNNGKLHRNDGPAFIVYRGDKIIEKTWYRDDKRHRIGDPAKIKYNGIFRTEEWYREGRRHRIGGPAVIEYRYRKIIAETWFENGEIHRVDGPADIRYGDAGQVKSMRYYEGGSLHRIGGPADIDYDDVGNVRFERYFVNGR